MRQWMTRLLAVMLLVPGLAVVSQTYASADCQETGSWVPGVTPGTVTYVVTSHCPADSTPGNNPGGSPAPPPCDLASAPPATFCWGSAPCYYKDVVTPYAPPSTEPPVPGSDWHVRMCLPPGGIGGWTGTALWIGQDPPPSPLDQALQAFGQLRVPPATLAFNPTRRTLVNVDTWFWADGLTAGELRGSSAFGLVAIATPGRLHVTPGDGSPSFSCAWVTAKADTCSYPYQHSSVNGSARGADGAPAYEATGSATWTVRFETSGAPVTIAGAPTELTGPAMRSAVEVAEVQTIVTGTS